ncbi:rRNA-processing protein bfr2 [Mycoemilia scoparia]|uniref:Protein BFR2 n=1 Tax=Mycoemilia scoparia TaxID=417184 RepID=A0A9W7ZV55_9FUNG|nr:rRNA-processing protein bfr2 [Mycoemilia scoparia]
MVLKKGKKKSLGEQLSELANPTPKDVDIETEDFYGANSTSKNDNESSSDNESDEDNEDLAREHYVSVGRSDIRMSQGIENLGPKYTGKQISRNDIYEQSESESEQELGDNNEDDSSDEPDGYGDNQDESEKEEDEDDDDDEDDKINRQLKELEKGEKALLQSLAQDSKNDIEKGQHVLHQTRLWDGLLDIRIRTQKLINLSNELPQKDDLNSILAEFEDNDLDSPTIEETKEEVYELLDGMLDFRQRLWNQNGGQINKSLGKYKFPQKRKADDLDSIWEDMENTRNLFRPYRDSTLEKWGKKVQASGGIPLNKSLKAINQGVLHQIQQALANGDRLVQRTRIKRVPYKIIGKENDGSGPKDKDEDSDLREQDPHLKDQDPEIFDDVDFYQQLLRELIESRMVDTDDPTGSLGSRWAAIKQQTKSKKKNVDTKASKGRKLRYHVQEKIQNWMAPIPKGTWHGEMVDELFSTLFGQKVAVVSNNGQGEDDDGDSSADEQTNVGNDNLGEIRLFA